MESSNTGKIVVLTMLVCSIGDAQKIIKEAKQKNLLAENGAIQGLLTHPKSRTTNIFATDRNVPVAKIMEISLEDIPFGTEKKKQEKKSDDSDRFIGLEELFWECHGIRSKHKNLAD